MRWVDGHVFFGPAHCLRCSERSARRIMSHLTTRRVPFAFEAEDGYFDIFVPEDLLLTSIKQKIDVNWEFIRAGDR